MRRPLDTIRIEPGEHVAFMGMTGSGKSVLARKMLESLNRVLVVDPKREYTAEGFKRRLMFPLPFEKEFRLIWSPRRDQDAQLADLLRRAFKRKRLTIYVDELQSLTDFFPLSTDIFTDIIRTGRSRQVAAWVSTQRPAWVPRWFLSETRHKFIFTLLDSDDRNRAADLVGDRAKQQVELHHFLYHAPGLDRAELLTYDLKRNTIVQVEPPVIPQEEGES